MDPARPPSAGAAAASDGEGARAGQPAAEAQSPKREKKVYKAGWAKAKAPKPGGIPRRKAGPAAKPGFDPSSRSPKRP